jgi:hypothetical protein
MYFSSELENIFYNIAQTDFASGHWQTCMTQIEARLSKGSEDAQLVGFRALKELVRAFQYESDDKRKMLIQIGEHFLPFLEKKMMETIQNVGSPNQLKFMILISKIFYMCNAMKVMPFLLEAGKLSNWIEIIVAILES